ncbi:MAG TPA: cyclic nucleotide-binding domain-containing protein [Terriglobia bacterium]|nr:cyclic nucleotide-binding domain-containing protein [Terriglobia bacterium]
MSAVEKVLFLQRVDIFKYATTEMLAYIGAVAEVVVTPSAFVIFSEQEMSDAMYVVVRGRVRLEKDGREIILIGPGQSAGAWALFDHSPRLMSAVALEETVLLKIRSETFYEFLADHDEVTPAIFKAVIERVKGLTADTL